ncbi:purine-nucleoside phosphorylase [uncultured Eubacterium sp.]|uniref:purine-nucleoside phosphorylase n=1 Tax=uncultured Eubacterium sp. TaxID=165185 RepID=UPI0025F26562|nr:purine-nucleoside phosphorylase [uncultured Eubacterium sp.]
MQSKQLRYIKEITDFTPEIAIILGSGLGGLANEVSPVAEIEYKDIPDMPVSTAPSHKGKFIFGKLEGKNVVLMQGRVHLYEGYSSKQIADIIRLLKDLGVNTLILTNAAGGINKELSVGDFMLINDHISCFIDSPLIGANNENYGTRFPDMSNAYDKDLQKLIKNVAYKNNIELKEGTYVQLKGPQFETPSEIKMLSALGADAVGMSTVVETISAVHCGLKVGAISMISNSACGIYDKPLSGEDVTIAAEKAGPQFRKLIKEIIKAL